MFKEKILNRTKEQTIRRLGTIRKRDYKKWKKTRKFWYRLYWKMRTPDCEALMEVAVKNMIPIQMKWKGFGEVFAIRFENGKELSLEEKRKLAHDDGFEDLAGFKLFFANHYNLRKWQNLVIIRW